MSMAIVPHDQGESGESFCIAMRLTLRNGGSGGTGRLWCRYVVARAVAILVDIVREGVRYCFLRFFLVAPRSSSCSDRRLFPRASPQGGVALG